MPDGIAPYIKDVLRNAVKGTRTMAEGGEDRFSGTKSSLNVRFSFQVSTILEANAVAEFPRSETMIADYCMITMGGRVEQFEAVRGTKEFTNEGIVRVDHTFKPIGGTHSYYNQMEYPVEETPVTNHMRDCGLTYDDPDEWRIKSHVIVWLFRRHLSDVRHKDETKAEHVTTEENADTMVRRCYLLGTLSLPIDQVMSKTLEWHQEKCQGDAPFWTCGHNFCGSKVACRIVQRDDLLNEEIRKEQWRQHSNLVKGLADWQAEEDRCKSEVSTHCKPDHSKHAFMVSPLKNLQSMHAIVKLQQGLMKAYCVLASVSGLLVMGDRLGGSFISGSTYTQLYKNKVCFTDMTSIVRKRVVEFPFQMLGYYTYAAIQMSGMTAKEVASLSSHTDRKKLTSIYKAIMSAEMMDSKQAEYYSDFCVFGAEDANEFEYTTKRQPDPELDRGCEGERWVYEMYHPEEGGSPKYVRYRLRMTEDQRQVCTAEHGVNVIDGDDCETQASTIMAIKKTADAIRAALIRVGVFTEDIIDDDAFREWVENRGKWKDDEFNKLLEQFMPKKAYDDEQEHRAYFLLALANILRQFEFVLDLCIGTANAAGVGQAKNLCGHCYTIMTWKNLRAGEEEFFIVEGTNWVIMEKILDSDMMYDAKANQALGELATILMEATKSGDINPEEDIGKGLVTMAENRDEDEFYNRVYVCGDKFYFSAQRAPTGKRQMVFGVRVKDLIDRMPVYKIQVNYKLVSEHLKANGTTIDPWSITNSVRAIAQAEAVPAWSVDRWNDIMAPFYKTEVHYVPEEGSKFDPEVHSRFVFVHRVFDHGKGAVGSNDNAEDEKKQHVDKLVQSIKALLVDGEKKKAALAITKVHEGRLQADPSLWDKEIAKKWAEYPGKEDGRFFLECMEKFDAESVASHLDNIHNFIHVEKIFTCMQNVVTVCYINRDQIMLAHERYMKWIKAISDCGKERKELIRCMRRDQFREQMESGKVPGCVPANQVQPDGGMSGGESEEELVV